MSAKLTMSAKKNLLIVAHIPSDNTRRLRDAVIAGASSPDISDVELRALIPFEAQPTDVKWADAVILGTTENLGYMSGALKDFFDRSYYGVLDQVNGRPYATLICAGSDGTNAARQIERIATGWRLKPVAEPLIVCTHAQTPEAILAPKQIGADELARCRALGETMATGLALGVF